VIPIAQSASAKAAILTAIALLLLIPSSLLGSLVTERTARRDAAMRSVARGWGDRQWIGGPVLAIPVTTESDQLVRASGTCFPNGWMSVWSCRYRIRAADSACMTSLFTSLACTRRVNSIFRMRLRALPTAEPRCIFISTKRASCFPFRIREGSAI